jgi:hypothetical protein
MYHRSLLALVAKAWFDVGRLLHGLSNVASEGDRDEDPNEVRIGLDGFMSSGC